MHTALGPGLLESAYQACLSHELKSQNIDHACEVVLPVEYKGLRIDCGYRIDLLFPDKLIVELKCVSAFEPVYSAQLLTYMKLARLPIGLLINFNVPKLKNGIKRFVL